MIGASSFFAESCLFLTNGTENSLLYSIINDFARNFSPYRYNSYIIPIRTVTKVTCFGILTTIARLYYLGTCSSCHILFTNWRWVLKPSSPMALHISAEIRSSTGLLLFLSLRITLFSLWMMTGPTSIYSWCIGSSSLFSVIRGSPEFRKSLNFSSHRCFSSSSFVSLFPFVSLITPM